MRIITLSLLALSLSMTSCAHRGCGPKKSCKMKGKECKEKKKCCKSKKKCNMKGKEKA